MCCLPGDVYCWLLAQRLADSRRVCEPVQPVCQRVRRKLLACVDSSIARSLKRPEWCSCGLKHTRALKAAKAFKPPECFKGKAKQTERPNLLNKPWDGLRFSSAQAGTLASSSPPSDRQDQRKHPADSTQQPFSPSCHACREPTAHCTSAASAGAVPSVYQPQQTPPASWLQLVTHSVVDGINVKLSPETALGFPRYQSAAATMASEAVGAGAANSTSHTRETLQISLRYRYLLVSHTLIMNLLI